MPKPGISTHLVEDKDTSNKNMKPKTSEWDLKLDDNRPVSQNQIPSPTSVAGKSLFVSDPADRMSQGSNLNTERAKEVDNESAQDFVKKAFEDASEKNITGTHTDIKQ